MVSKRSKMNKWEYRVMLWNSPDPRYSEDLLSWDGWLNLQGQECWELVVVDFLSSAKMCTFKRKILDGE